jgi:segregation and condensation protein B
MAALETLAIVAYRQPVTGPEIQELRGKSPVAALKTLLDRRMIRIAGRKEVVGRPFLYATTREFLMHFGLRSLAELPPLEEFEETFGTGAEPAAADGASTEHAAIGLLSIEEAEAALGSSRFGVHEHGEHEPEAAAGERSGRDAADDGAPVGEEP